MVQKESAEVAKKFNAKLVIDIQGDEPLVDPRDIDRVINFHLKNKNFEIVVPSMITKNPERNSLVKVIFNKQRKSTLLFKSINTF